MKKIIVLLLLFVYTITTIGATLHLHYCMGKYVGWSFFENHNNECGKCGMKEDEKKKGCCKDENKTFKLNADHQKSSVPDFSFLTNTIFITVPINYFVFAKKTITEDKNNFKNYRPPPNIHTNSLQVLYCSFLI